MPNASQKAICSTQVVNRREIVFGLLMVSLNLSNGLGSPGDGELGKSYWWAYTEGPFGGRGGGDSGW